MRAASIIRSIWWLRGMTTGFAAAAVSRAVPVAMPAASRAAARSSHHSCRSRALAAVKNHKRFGFNYDPSHLGYQGVDYVKFIRTFGPRIFHAHMKDVWWGHGDGTVRGPGVPPVDRRHRSGLRTRDGNTRNRRLDHGSGPRSHPRLSRPRHQRFRPGGGCPGLRPLRINIAAGGQPRLRDVVCASRCRIPALSGPRRPSLHCRRPGVP